MIEIRVHCEPEYRIQIGRGLLDRCGDAARGACAGRNALVISDSHVAPLYANRVLGSLTSAGFRAALHTFPAGEANKQLSTVTSMLEAMCRAGLTRADLVVALGGGVTGDMAAFASSIYLRGIRFLQVPTSLLSQVDSSVGGKTGCDLPAGKNLIGTFANPAMVLIDPDTLQTLPPRYFRDGLAEVIKAALIRDAGFFDRLSREDPANYLETVIETCVNIKRTVVEHDFREQGERMLLNFGHTLGHAIEACQHYTGLSHGEAVAVGMAQVTAAAERQGLTAPGTAEQVAACLRRNGLPTTTDLSSSELFAYLSRDKKRRGKEMNLVLLHKPGAGYVYQLPAEALPAFFEEDAL